MIIDPCAALDFAVARERPSSPMTPLLFADSRPEDAELPAAFEERTVAFAVPFDVDEAALDVFIIAPDGAPDAALPEAIALFELAPLGEAGRGAARATIDAWNEIDWLFGSRARSKEMPTWDSA